jgi:hypothetical protein
MYANEVFGVQYAVLILEHIVSTLSSITNPSAMISPHLSCCIDDLRGKLLPSMSYDLAEGVFDSGVVALDEVAVYELDCEGGFTYLVC